MRRLEAEGYEIRRGKYISFRAPGQERFTRCKTLGEAYTEEALAEHINGKVILKTPKPELTGVSLLIDIENCIKAQQSAGYERWAKIENLKRAARAGTDRRSPQSSGKPFIRYGTTDQAY